MKLKNEKRKKFKIRFVFKPKKELYFRYKSVQRKYYSIFILKLKWKSVRVYFVHSIFNSIFWLKIDFYPNFQSNLISNSLIRFWILKNKSIMEIQFLKWKLKIQFSIFNFLNWDLDSFSILIFCFSNNIWNCVKRGNLYNFFAEKNRKWNYTK